MKERRVSVPELALLALTRSAAGFGFGLLLADRWSESQRRAIGWTLALMGLVSTIPIALEIFGRNGLPERSESLQSESFEPILAVVEG